MLNERVRSVQFVRSCHVVYHKLRSASAIENHDSYLDGFHYASPCFNSAKYSCFRNLFWNVFSFWLLHIIHWLMSMINFERLIEYRILICQTDGLVNYNCQLLSVYFLNIRVSQLTKRFQYLKKMETPHGWECPVHSCHNMVCLGNCRHKHIYRPTHTL